MINPLFIIIGVVLLIGLQVFVFLLSFMKLGIFPTLIGASIVLMIASGGEQ